MAHGQPHLHMPPQRAQTLDRGIGRGLDPQRLDRHMRPAPRHLDDPCRDIALARVKGRLGPQ